MKKEARKKLKKEEKDSLYLFGATLSTKRTYVSNYSKGGYLPLMCDWYIKYCIPLRYEFINIIHMPKFVIPLRSRYYSTQILPLRKKHYCLK